MEFFKFFFHSFSSFFSVSFFPLSFSFMLAPPFQCSSIFLVVHNYIAMYLLIIQTNDAQFYCVKKGGCGMFSTVKYKSYKMSETVINDSFNS